MADERPRLGDILVRSGFITEEHIRIALRVQKVRRMFLGETLKTLGFISPKEMAIALAEQAKMTYLDLHEIFPSKDVLFLFEKREAETFNAICVDQKSNEVVVVIDDPYDVRKHAAVRNRLKDYTVSFRIAEKETITKHIEVFYKFYSRSLEEEFDDEVKKITTGAGDVVRIVNIIMDWAFYLNTSDIHISPLADTSFLFFRIDGILHPVSVMPLFVHNNVVSRIKLLGGMNVAERRVPQDGSFSHESMGETVDVRISTLPTTFGEKVVMRILRKDISRLNLAFLGYHPRQLSVLKEAAGLPFGMVILSGPTGSGKSTTLYSMLRSIDYLKRNVITVEDPVEYKFNFIYQTEVSEATGYKFSTALRYLMRQDPDVILVGEIRDDETARVSVDAANTGHLLLSTVHANDAVTTVYRLMSLCPEKDITLSVLKVISAQRLLRKLCPFCREEDPDGLELIQSQYPKIFNQFEAEPTVFKSRGCDKCRGIGYIGRSVVSEVLKFDTELVDAFLRDLPLMKIRSMLDEKGFLDMEKSAIYKVLRGETDLAEARRVVR